MEAQKNSTDIVLGQLIAKADESIRLNEATKTSVSDLSKEFKESHRTLSSEVAGHGTRLTVIETEIGTLKTVRKDVREGRFSLIQMIGIMVGVAVGATSIYAFIERVIS